MHYAQAAEMVRDYRKHDEGTWGSFYEALLRAFGSADSGNFERLAQGFPELAQAFRDN